MQPVQTTPRYWLAPGGDLAPRTWQRRTRRPVIIISSIAGVILAILGIGAFVIGSQTRDFTAEGAVVLSAGQYEVSEADVCSGSGEFEDIRAGTRVRILDTDLTVLEQSALAAPRLSAGECRLDFSVPGVPEDRDRYVVEVGDVFRYETSGSVLDGGIEIAP